MNKFIDELTGERLYIATDLDGGDLLGAVWAKSESEAYDYFNNDAPMIPDQLDRLYVELAEESSHSIEAIMDEFPDLFNESVSGNEKEAEKLAESTESDLYEMVAARAMHFMFTNYNMDYQEIADELGIDVQVVLDLIGPDSYDDAFDDSDIMLEAATDEPNIKGVRTITIHSDTDEKVILEFKTFEEAAKHFEDLYVNAVEETYAEEVLYPIMNAAKNEEYDYIADDGYAVIEADATGAFDGALDGIWDDDEIDEDFQANVESSNLKESYRRTVSRGKPLNENELFIDFE